MKIIGVLFLRYKAKQSFFVILSHFLHFDPPNRPKNQDFEEMKNTSADIIISHLCNTNDDHMMYGSWGIGRNKQNFLSFWAIFCPFNPLSTQKIKVLKKNERDAWNYHNFTQMYQKSYSYAILFLRYGALQM